MSSLHDGRTVTVLALFAIITSAYLAWGEHRRNFVALDPMAEAWRALEQDQSAAAQALARSVLAREPLRADAYRLLAESAEKSGQLDQASQLYAQALLLQPRDLLSRQWLAAEALARGDVITAVGHYDRMLLVRPELAAKIYPLLTQLVEHGAAGAVLPWLVTDPPWRAGFLAHAAESVTDVDVLHALFQPLARSTGSLHDRERNAYLERLLREQRYIEAYQAWVAFLPVAGRAALGNVFDGGFEQPPENGGFGWRIGRVAGARIEQVDGSAADGKQALHVLFSNQRVPFNHVSQMLALAPGEYQLQGNVRVDNLRNERGLQWRVVCADDDRRVLAETERVSGTEQWRPFSAVFSVPERACRAQWLQLTLAARIPAEQYISGQAWYDDLRIIRQRP